MVAIAQTALRASEFLWTLLILSLVGNVIAEAFAGNPSSINWSMFVAAFSMVVVLYGIAANFVTSLAIPIVTIVLDGLAALFTFITGVVFAAYLHVHSCGNQVNQVQLIVARASANMLLDLSQNQPYDERISQPG